MQPQTYMLNSTLTGCGVPHADAVLSLEERGLALSMTALRVAYSKGGDGEQGVNLDLRQLAAFVRDPAAIVTTALLPLSCSATFMSKVPLCTPC